MGKKTFGCATAGAGFTNASIDANSITARTRLIIFISPAGSNDDRPQKLRPIRRDSEAA
jgi:hypothetical protein